MFPLVVMVLLTRTAYADVVITEIMYDPSGSDQGHEWVEIMNDGGAPVAVQDMRFVEADVRHLIKEASGGMNLAPGAVAVIVQDSAVFSNTYPGYQGQVFLSSFSLRQQEGIGEPLGIYNTSSDRVEHAVTYVPDERAGGTGASLHLTLSGVQVPAPATPGSIAINPIAESPEPAGFEQVQEAVQPNMPQKSAVSVVLPEVSQPVAEPVSEARVSDRQDEFVPNPDPRQSVVMVQETTNDRYGVFALWLIAVLLSIVVLELFVIARRLRRVRRS